MVKLTEAQREILDILDCSDYLTPAEIGWAIPRDKSKRPLKPQGAGRVGSSMAVRLIKMGLAKSASWKRDGYPAYSITEAGRAALTESQP